jgi:hypothetical protein
MRGEGTYAEMIAQRFKAAVKRLGLSTDMPPLNCAAFAPPPQPGDQLALF